MYDERTTQKEFFEFEKPRRPASPFGKIFTKSNVTLTLTLERLIFISIGVVMVMVLIYALGIEKGKTLAKAIPNVKSEPAPAAASATVAAPIIKERVPAPVVEKSADVEAKPYTIVAVTLKKEESASMEARRLKTEGLDAFVAQSDSFFLVCIGAYPEKESALSKRALNKVRQRYKDAYFKLR